MNHEITLFYTLKYEKNLLNTLDLKLCNMSSVDSDNAEVNGTRLYYEIFGFGEPIVLIHGGYCDLRVWDDQVQDFSERHKLIRYDLRGHGKSALPTPNKSYKHHEDLSPT